MLFKCLYFYYGLHLWIIGIYSKLARKTFTVLEKNTRLVSTCVLRPLRRTVTCFDQHHIPLDNMILQSLPKIQFSEFSSKMDKNM